MGVPLVRHRCCRSRWRRGAERGVRIRRHRPTRGGGAAGHADSEVEGHRTHRQRRPRLHLQGAALPWHHQSARPSKHRPPCQPEQGRRRRWCRGMWWHGWLRWRRLRCSWPGNLQRTALHGQWTGHRGRRRRVHAGGDNLHNHHCAAHDTADTGATARLRRRRRAAVADGGHGDVHREPGRPGAGDEAGGSGGSGGAEVTRAEGAKANRRTCIERRCCRSGSGRGSHSAALRKRTATASSTSAVGARAAARRSIQRRRRARRQQSAFSRANGWRQSASHP
mmetsp:Transcript_31070/g.103500  ORF Transcript_31070/g.103500 Transcript_31070/m.103500 type:complete len:280 (+) Transcript_31070:408-1247(+)